MITICSGYMDRVRAKRQAAARKARLIAIAQYLACLLLMGWLILAAGCQMGQTVMVSKGQAGGFAQIFSGTADYCKLAATEGVELTPEDRQAFQVYCGRDE